MLYSFFLASLVLSALSGIGPQEQDLMDLLVPLLGASDRLVLFL
jgi:hypothetical protein